MEFIAVTLTADIRQYNKH